MSYDLSQAIELIIGRFDQVAQRFDTIDGRFDRVEHRLEQMQEEITRVRVDTMQRLDRQQDLLTSLKDDITVETAAVDNTREKFSQIRNDYDQLAHQVSVVHRRLMALEKRLDFPEHGA